MSGGISVASPYYCDRTLLKAPHGLVMVAFTPSENGIMLSYHDLNQVDLLDPVNRRKGISTSSALDLENQARSL